MNRALRWGAVALFPLVVGCVTIKVYENHEPGEALHNLPEASLQYPQNFDRVAQAAEDSLRDLKVHCNERDKIVNGTKSLTLTGKSSNDSTVQLVVRQVGEDQPSVVTVGVLRPTVIVGHPTDATIARDLLDRISFHLASPLAPPSKATTASAQDGTTFEINVSNHQSAPDPKASPQRPDEAPPAKSAP